jgi:hypothetical protein
MLILPVGFDYGRWERQLIRRVGEVLGLQAQAGMPLIARALFALNAAIQKIAAIHLNARLRGKHAKRSAAHRII